MAGLYTDASILYKCILQLVNCPKAKAGGAVVLIGLLSVVNVFVKHFGQEILATHPLLEQLEEPDTPDTPSVSAEGSSTAKPSTAVVPRPFVGEDSIVSQKMQQEMERLICHDFLSQGIQGFMGFCVCGGGWVAYAMGEAWGVALPAGWGAMVLLGALTISCTSMSPWPSCWACLRGAKPF